MLDKCGGSDFLLANGFRFYFTGITSLLFTFPSRYWSTIGEVEYLALASSLACFPQGSLSRAVLKYRYSEHVTIFAYWAITIYGAPFQDALTNQITFNFSSAQNFRSGTYLTYNCHSTESRKTLGYSLFARHY
jgi:hypothetical protein